MSGKPIDEAVRQWLEEWCDDHGVELPADAYNELLESLTAAQQQGQVAPPSAPVGVEEMQRRLDREESDHGRTIDQRDAAEDALGRMFQAVTGRVAEWSSAWGYTDAIEEVEEHVAALAQQPAAVDGANGVDWRAMYRFQTAMRYMDNNPKLTKQQADKMADDDCAALAAQHQEPTT